MKEKAKAGLQWPGYGLQHCPTRKRADFLLVVHHERTWQCGA